MPALVPFISHFGPKIQRSFSYFPSLRSYFSSSYYNRRSGGVIGTASSGTATGPSSLPGRSTDRKSNRQSSWGGNKVKIKSDYLELTGLSSNTATITDDNEERDGRVHIKDLESGLQQRTANKVVPSAQDVDSPLQWSNTASSVRRAEIESKPPNKVPPAQDAVDSRLQWSPVAVVRPPVIGSTKPPNKHIESGLQSNPLMKVGHPDIESPLPAMMTGRRSQSQSPTHDRVESGSQWSPVSLSASRHPEIESSPPATTSRHFQSQSPSQSQSPTPSHVESRLQSNFHTHVTRTDHRPQLPTIKHIDSPLRMHPPSPR